MGLFSKAAKISDNRCVNVVELPNIGFKLEGITVDHMDISVTRIFFTREATLALRDILNEIEFEDEPREEVREKPKHKNHESREE